jgi:acetyl esterase/lipase
MQHMVLRMLRRCHRASLRWARLQNQANYDIIKLNHLGFGLSFFGFGAYGTHCLCQEKRAEALPSPPKHHILRPHLDARVDKTVLVQYDPPPGSARTGAAVVICPGGNYEKLANHEGQHVAAWLAQLGIVSFVLRYRLISEGYYWPAQLQDIELAIAEIRRNSEEWKVDVDKIGVMGFSAGGHLASYAATRSASPWRPNAQILVYPTIDCTKPDWWPWNAKEGFPPASESTHLDVSSSTPPAFLVCSTEDGICDAHENTDVYAEKLKAVGVPFEYVKKPMGKHGHGLKGDWKNQCANWLQNLGWAVKD